MINPLKYLAGLLDRSQGETDPLARETYFIPTDSLFVNQWHLNNTGQSGGTAGVDINVTGVWDDYTGARNYGRCL